MKKNHTDDEDENGLTPEEQLHADNEMELLRLNMEYGAESFISEDAPPEVVRMFLDQVKSFEEKWKDDPELALIGDVIENEEYPLSDDILEHELEDHIEQFLEMLIGHGIMIDRPDHLTPRQYYEFLTLHLPYEEVMADRPPGFINGLLYDDIRKDNPALIPNIAEEEIRDIIYSTPYEAINLGPEAPMQKSLTEIKSDISAWQSKYPGRRLDLLELDTHLVDDNIHRLTYDIKIRHNAESESNMLSGICIVTIELVEGEYYVTSLLLPDLQIT